VTQVRGGAPLEHPDQETAPETGLPPVTLLPDVVSFPTLFRREYAGLVALAWGLTGCRETAEDIAQESLLVLHRRWDDLVRIENPAAYARRTCANLSVSWVRRRAREARAVARLRGRRPADAPVDQNTDAFWAAVRLLPRRQAQATALFYGLDLGVDEVAEVLQMAPGTVKAHLHRARAALATTLSADGAPAASPVSSRPRPLREAR
jgi:RNA polymerase sigma-70 factor (ECF subfamily)